MSKRNKKRLTRRQQEIRRKRLKKRRRRRRLVIILELIILCILGTTAFGLFKLGKMERTNLSNIKNNGLKQTGYTNVALFGLDSREGELDGGVQSDCMMIASINNKTNEVKLISLYRDTLLKQENGKYQKANSAYHTGGPAEAIALMNRNLDLDIEKYISVNFNALADIIDALGGIDLDFTEDEIKYTNMYCDETEIVVGRETSRLKGAGTHHVDGIQAVAYTRIRYTSGMDFERTHRQRIVLEKVAKKAQKANFITLNKIVNEVFPMISTSFSSKQILGFAANALNYNLVSTNGFPYQVTTSETVKNHSGVSFVIPIGLEQNVKQLHQELFNDDSYEASDKVKEIDSDIVYLTDITADNTDAMESTFKGDSLNEGTE